MILVTGGTGFIGNVLLRHLSDLGHQVKLLIRPTQKSPTLPKGHPLDAAVSSLTDERGLRAAMKNVDIIYHLASAEALGREAQLTEVDIQGTQAVINAARQANIKRIVYISHLGADRASAFPLLKAKDIAEHHIKSSGIPYTIIRSAVVFGEADHFSSGLAFLLKVSPYVVMVPDHGATILQPIWVEDLARVMTWSLDIPETVNQTLEVGGPEYLSFQEICRIIAASIHIKRQYINVSPVLLNVLTELIEILYPRFPTSVFWLDYLAANRTTNLDTLPRLFNLLPARMSKRLGYLEGQYFRRNWWRIIFQRKRTTK